MRTHAPVAERVLLPGDPGRALRLAQACLDNPKMLNHNRGLWGYTGAAADGRPMTIQSTGMGGPSAAIVVEELIALGARRLVRVGTCGALAPGLALGELIAVTGALGFDGASRALLEADGNAEAAADPAVPRALLPDAALAAAVDAAAGLDAARGPVATTDLFYDPREPEPRWSAAGAIAVEMECAAVFAVAARHDVAAGALLAVSDLLAEGERVRIDDEQLHAAELELGRVAVAALS